MGIIRIENLDDMNKYKHIIPKNIFEDVNKRINDWMEGEDSTMEDQYILRQFYYIEDCLNILIARKEVELYANNKRQEFKV